MDLRKEKIIVFGASGFLGSWFVRTASSHGIKVIAVVRPSSNILRLTGIHDLDVNIIEAKNWPNFITELQPTTIISFDWEGVGQSERNSPNQIINIARTLKLAQAAIQSDVKDFLVFGSQAEVGPVNMEIQEVTDMNPTTEYGKAKKNLLLELHKQFKGTNTRFIWGRIFSTYGQLESSNWLLPQLISALEKQKEFSMTKGDQVWNYLHAYDFSMAVIKILETNYISGIINIANPENVKISEVATYVGKKMNALQYINFGDIKYSKDQVMNLLPNIEKLLSTGWQSVISINTGVDDLVSWRLYGQEKFKIGPNLVIRVPSFEQFKNFY